MERLRFIFILCVNVKSVLSVSCFFALYCTHRGLDVGTSGGTAQKIMHHDVAENVHLKIMFCLHLAVAHPLEVPTKDILREVNFVV